jgi:hypothetical protein
MRDGRLHALAVERAEVVVDEGDLGAAAVEEDEVVAVIAVEVGDGDLAAGQTGAGGVGEGGEERVDGNEAVRELGAAGGEQGAGADEVAVDEGLVDAEPDDHRVVAVAAGAQLDEGLRERSSTTTTRGRWWPWRAWRRSRGRGRRPRCRRERRRRAPHRGCRRLEAPGAAIEPCAGEGAGASVLLGAHEGGEGGLGLGGLALVLEGGDAGLDDAPVAGGVALAAFAGPRLLDLGVGVGHEDGEGDDEGGEAEELAARERGRPQGRRRGRRADPACRSTCPRGQDEGLARGSGAATRGPARRGGRADLAGADAGDQLAVGLAGEGALAVERLVEGDAEAEDVGAGVGAGALVLLRRPCRRGCRGSCRRGSSTRRGA